MIVVDHSLRKNGRVLVSDIHHVPVFEKSQGVVLGVINPPLLVSSVKDDCVIIWTVVKPVPPALVACPDVWVSQKPLVTEP